jgi:hypothetical protein
MLRTLFVFSALLAFEGLPCNAQQVRVSGTVTAVDPSAKTLVMKMEAGPEVTINLGKSVTLQPGQRVVVNGRISKDEKAVDAVEVQTATKSCGKDTPIHAALASLYTSKGCTEPVPATSE